MTRRIYIICHLFFCLLAMGHVNAQRTIEPGSPQSFNKGVIYNSEWAIEPRWQTNGFGLALLFANIHKYNVTHFKKIEIGQLKHGREHRQQSAPTQFGGGLNGYIFGKINYFFPIRATIGTKRYFSEKARRKGIAVGLSYEAGPVLGILKPYYLRLTQPDVTSNERLTTVERYTEDNADIFLDPSRIAGSGGFFRGFNEFSIKPGISGRIGSHFSWGAYDEHVLALEVGMTVDIYLDTIDLVANDDNDLYFIGFYVSLQLGKRK